jgi:transposase-like protein
MTEPTKLESALDELLTGKSTEEIVGPDGLLKQLTKALIERAMNAELNDHLGYEKHAPEGRGSGNNRNGRSRKKVQGDFGAVEIEVRLAGRREPGETHLHKIGNTTVFRRLSAETELLP